MALLVWVPELDTGIAEIDRQHRRIVDYINRLYELRSSPDREGLGDVIGEMIDYTFSHFVFEESLIESAGFDRRTTLVVNGYRGERLGGGALTRHETAEMNALEKVFAEQGEVVRLTHRYDSTPNSA